MKKLIALLFLVSSVQAQVIIEQDERNATQLNIQHVLVDNTDGYTGETGLTPTCKISIPGATDFSACANSAVESDSTDAPGVYRVALAPAEWESHGTGMMVLTGTGAIPSRVPFTIRPSKLYTNNNLILYPNNLAGSGWTLTAATVTQNSTADFNGDTIGDTLTADGTTAQHFVNTTSTVKRRGGSGFYVSSVEVKAGTAANVWIGDSAWGAGVDFNTSTQAVTPAANVYLRGWRAENIGSSWYRVSILYQVPTSDATYTLLALGIGNGTVGSAPPSFSSSGTMIFARAVHSRAEDVSPELLKMILPSLQSASSSSSVTLAASELNSSQFMRNREICFILTNGTSMGYAQCACIVDYDGSTKVATITPTLTTTLSSTYKYRMGGICPSKVNVGSFDANSFASGVFATDAIGPTNISATAAAKVADVTLRRTTANIEASSFGDAVSHKSLYGTVAKQQHKNEIATVSGSKVLKTYKADGTTVLSTRDVTTQSGAAPVVGVDD